MVFQGTLSSSTTHELCLIVHNNGPKEIIITEHDDIAELIVHQSSTSSPMQIKPFQKKKKRKPKQLNNVDTQLLAQQSPNKSTSQSTTMSRAASILSKLHKLKTAINLSFDYPYSLDLSPDLYENYTSRYISLKSQHPTLGLKLQPCPH